MALKDAFVWGAGGSQLTPDQIARQREIAAALIRNGVDYSPVQSWTQGAARVSQGILGALEDRQADNSEKANTAADKALQGPLIEALTSSAISPAAVAGPSADAAGVPVAAASPVTPGGNPDVASYIQQAAAARGIDPNIALRVAGHEGLNVFDPSKPDGGGDEGSSFGPFQLHYSGMSKSMPHAGLGDEFTASTGLDARDPSTWQKQIDFSLDYAKNKGWGPWMGAKAEGITGMMGIGNQPRVAAGQPPAPNQVASLDPSAGMGAPQQPAYVDPRVTTAYQQPAPAAPAVQAIQQQAPQVAGLDPNQASSPPLSPPVDIASQPISNPAPVQVAQAAPVDRSGVGMGGAAPGAGYFPPAPSQNAQQSPVAAPSQGGGVSPAVIAALTSPTASPATRQLAGAIIQQAQTRQQLMLKQQLEQADPAYKTKLATDQIQLQNLQHPENVVPESMRVLNARATAAGFQPGTPAYQQFMASGGQVQRNESPPPAGYRNVRDDQGNIINIEPIPGSPAALALDQKAQSKEMAGNVITSAASLAREAVNAPGTLPAIGSGSDFASNFSSSNATEVRRQVGVLKANSTIENLNAMRAASPTGGALGSVTEGEEKILADKAGALDPSSPKFLRDLDAYEKVSLETIHGLKAGDQIWLNGNKKRYPNAPEVGAVDQGHKYIGGNPAEPDSWETVN